MSGVRKLVPQESRELLGSPFDGGVGDIVNMSVDLGGTVTVDGDSWMHAFKGTTNVSSSVLSGALSASGNILTLMTISSELAAVYRYTFRVTVNGQKLVYFFRRIVERESGAK